MRNNYKQKRQQGFTIIEVLIVLAIAALIFLIVFLAVPALQRNSRNTQRNNDVSNLLAGVNTFASNNNGTLPDTNSTWSSPVLTLKTVSISTGNEVKLGYYQSGIGTGSGNVTFVVAPVGLAPFAPQGPFSTSADDRVIIQYGAACDTSTPGKTKAGGAKAVVAVFEVEVGSNTYGPKCQEG